MIPALWASGVENYALGATVALSAGNFVKNKFFSKKRKTMKRGRSSQRSTQSMSRSRSRSRSYGPGYGQHPSISGGHYAGRLPRPKRPKRISKYDKAGYSGEVERFGTHALNDVNYLGVTSLCHADVGKAVGIAFIRKIMKRHFQYEYSDSRQLISPFAPQLSAQLTGGPSQLIIWYEEFSASTEPSIAAGWTYTIGSNTLEQFGTDFYTNVLTSTTFGQGQGLANYPLRRIHGYQFVCYDHWDSVATSFYAKFSTVYPLARQYLTVYSAVKLAIQNVTPADGGSLLTTHVDVNPIKGKLMHFSDLLPRLVERNGAFGSISTDNSFKLQIDPNGDGIIKPDGSLTESWTQIPSASSFANCNGEVGISLEPGAIKDYKIMFKFNGTLEKFMNGFSAFESPLQKGAFGTSCMFMLEKRMPTGATGVSVNFHYEGRFGCVFGKRLGAIMPKRGVAGVEITAADD